MSVATLLKAGHRLPDIKKYTLDQFVTFLDAAERAEAVARTIFVTDMTIAISGVLGGKDAVQNHLDSLRDTANGE